MYKDLGGFISCKPEVEKFETHSEYIRAEIYNYGVTEWKKLYLSIKSNGD